MITLPTDEQIKAAHDEITAAGSTAPDTISLVAFCLKNPITHTICSQIAAATGQPFSVVLGTFTAGFNLARRIK